MAERFAECENDPRVELGLVSPEVCVGADLFFNEQFDGNGRDCASCHAVENNFTIDPAFIATLDPSDPLFIASNDPGLATLERPQLLSQFALVLANADGTSDLANRFTMRSVPHMLSLATSLTPSTSDGTTTPPNQRTGWSGDGAPGNGELRDFMSGAIAQHFPVDLSRTPGVSFREPTEEELDAVLAFSLGLGRTNELDLNTVSLTDVEAEAGRVAFMTNGRCNGCHRNAGANNPGGQNKNFDTGVELVRISDVDALGIPGDGGFGGGSLASPDFDCNGDGTLDCFGNGTFNNPPLVEAADTGPYYHTNAFDTLESAIAFYNTVAFANSPDSRNISLSGVDVSRIGRFLRVINVALNVQMAMQRLDASRLLVDEFNNGHRSVQEDLILMGMVEIEDAIQVLRGAPQPLHSDLASELEGIHSTLDSVRTRGVGARRNGLEDALAELLVIDDALGANMDYTLGAANVMFSLTP